MTCCGLDCDDANAINSTLHCAAMGQRKMQVMIPSVDERAVTYWTAERARHLSVKQRASWSNMTKSASQRLSNLDAAGSVAEKDLIIFEDPDFEDMFAMKVFFF
jgi:hypothetical protein